MSSLFRGIGLSAIAGLSRRLGTGLHAGVGVLKLVDTEASYGSTKHKWRMSQVGKALRNGEPFAKALAAAQGYFPTLFIQMVHVGETSGRLERTLLMLAEHYEHRIKMRRLLLTGLAWPMIQLIGAIMVIGLVIWIQGVLAGPSGPSFDASGVGLSGTSGLVIYFGVVFSVAAIVIAAIVAVRENFMNVHRLIPYSYRLPVLGNAIQTISLSKICWTLSLTLDSGLDAIRSVRMSLNSAGSAHYAAGGERAKQAIRGGATLTGALSAAQVFPQDFLHAMEVAELSGTDAESLSKLAAHYDERAKMAMRVIVGAMTAAIWVTVTLLLVFMILRMALRIMGVYQDAMAPI